MSFRSISNKPDRPVSFSADGRLIHSSVFKQPDACLEDTRHRPRFYGSRARHSHSRAFSQLPPRQIVVRTYARKGVRSAGRCGCPQPRCTRQRTRAHPRLRSTSVHSRLHACAPHAVGLCGLLHVPGSAAFAHSPRSCELSPGHALGPSSVSPASHPCRRLGTAVPEASGARCRKDQPHPAPRIEDDRDAPSTGTGRDER